MAVDEQVAVFPVRDSVHHRHLRAPMWGTPPAADRVAAELREVSNVLAELDAAKRAVFILAELEEMTPPEISEALETPLTTACSRLLAARRVLQSVIAPQYER
jgi:DNA-directed RNA polymerase specialized sigma24 family protein